MKPITCAWSQKEPRIEQYVRQPREEWMLKEAAGLKAKIQLTSVHIVFRLEEVFAKVQFNPVPLRNR